MSIREKSFALYCGQGYGVPPNALVGILMVYMVLCSFPLPAVSYIGSASSLLATTKVNLQLVAGLALGLGVPERLPGEPEKMEDSYWCMRVIHYPPLPAPAAGADPPRLRCGSCLSF